MLSSRRARWRIAAALAVVLACCSGVFILLKEHRRPQERVSTRAADEHEPLLRKLNELESALKTQMRPEQMQRFASEIESETARHPLPDDDDIRFSAELIVRYLRELAAMENYQRLKLAAGNHDALSSTNSEANESIEVRKKYADWLPLRIQELRLRLSQTAQP